MKILLCLLLLLPGCYDGMISYGVKTNSSQKTFEEISQPFLTKYGLQEEQIVYGDDVFEFVEWHCWSKGLSVTFVHNTVIEAFGWVVQYTEKYCPI